MMTDTTPCAATGGIAAMLARKRAIRDRVDELNAEKSNLAEEENDIDRAIMDHMTAHGLTQDGAKLSDSGITVTRRTKWRANMLAENRAAVMQWCTANGYEYLFHARLSDAKVMELVDNGVALPEGLSVTPVTDLDFRRA